MVRVPCSEKPGLKKGPWTPEEDHKLITYIQSHDHCSWRAVPKQAGLARCGKSCRLRWTNYLRPGIKRGNFSPEEENTIIQLHAALGNRWSTISNHLPGRTDNEIKNHWNTRLRKKLLKMGIDPNTHRPLVQHPLPFQPSSINTLLLSLLQGASSPADINSSLLNTLLLGSYSLANTNGSFPAAPGHVLQSNPISSAPAAPPGSSIFPPPAALDPALLAAAETRIVLDCLKFNNGENHSSTSDQRLNQLLTRLLLLKLLQGSNNHAPPPSNPAACHANRTPIHSITEQPLSAADHLLRNQGLHQAGAILLPAPTNRQTAAAPAPPSSYVSPSLCADLNDGSLPTTMLLNMFSSSYQQRLLHTLPFLADSVMEPCTSAAATDHLSSTSPSQLSQASFFNCPPELNGSLTSQQTPLWPGQAPGRDNEVLPNGARAAAGVMQKQSLPGDSQVMASGAQLWAGAGIMQNNDSGPQSLMTWEEHLMTEQKGGDKDLGSSSTVSSSTMSSASECHATPNTPTHNFNIQEYWSDLLNLINSSK